MFTEELFSTIPTRANRHYQQHTQKEENDINLRFTLVFYILDSR
jgi:hypothetical protein